MMALAGTVAQPASAQTQTSAAEHTFQIPAQSLSNALIAFGQQAGVQFSMSADLTIGKDTPGLSGRYTVEAGLQRLLSNSGLTYRFAAANTIIIEKPIEGGHVLGAVQVEGVQATNLSTFGAGAGNNGSSDPTATEGSRSFTTTGANVASKVAQSLKDTPQSVTVITQERIQQQNMTDLGSALIYTPGITLYTNSTVQPAFYSRGFTLTTFKVDGGAALDLGSNSMYSTVPNLAEYDDVQVLRGSDAMFGGSAQPGGTVSLERKRPLDHDQFIFDATAGSWNNFLGQVDATGPVGLDGHLRVRFVFNDQDRDFFYKNAHQNKSFAYAVLEADLGPDTLLRGGLSYERQTNRGWTANGLPRYSDGSDLQLPVSTNLAPPWQRFDISTSEFFAALEHKFSADWGFKANFTRLAQDFTQLSAFESGLVFGNNPSESTYGDQSESLEYASSVQYVADATLNGTFEAFGLKQSIAVGADYSDSSSAYTVYASAQHATIPIDVFSGTLPQAVLTEPVTNIINVDQPLFHQEQWGGYATANLQPLKNLHVIGGARLSNYWYASHSTTYFTPTFLFASDTKTSARNVLTPYVAANYGLTPEITAYASYADIYQSQTGQDPKGNFLVPLQGVTYESGIKGAFKGGKLNASASYYYTKQRNVAERFTGSCAVGRRCYLAVGSVISKGVDLEVAGEILPGLQLQVGYNYNDNHTVYGTPATYQTQQPKHQLKGWISYVSSGALRRWTFSGGARMESARYVSGSVCSNPADTTDFCDTGVSVDFAFTQKLYAVGDLRVAYKFTDHLEAALNVTNISDTRYYTTVGSTNGFNFYGDPRAFTFSLRAKY